MLVDDARRIAAAIEERLNASACHGIKATVKSEQMSPETIPAGAGRPTFTNYFIQVDDGSRMATLTLGQAAGLVDSIDPNWDADQFFEAIRALNVPIEDKS
ncbi:MAG: hypothetical protein ACRDSR_05650 [Pseudonocardiaceae bacterium]